MQQRLVALYLLLWLTLSGSISLFISFGRDAFFFMWLLTALSPFLLRPLDWLTRQLLRKPCMLSRRKRITIHLSPWQPTAGLTPERVSWFWSGVFESAEAALAEGKTVVVASHLLTAARAAKLRKYLKARGWSYRSRLTSVPFRDSARALMQLEKLFRQWRWGCALRTEWTVMLLKKAPELQEPRWKE
ncbi:pili assembly chaperone [Pantoea stewartii]|uniref:pili assembly chaperone n=1 Tax=Pantoea stewartii TaxID=66269 RepID=UPI0019812BEA|nr:pili assembly chaperone [Pantoea stewartii]